MLPEYFISANVVDDFGRQHKKSAVDHATITFRLLDKTVHFIGHHLQPAKARRRMNCSQGREHIVGSVKCNQGADVDVADTVTIGQTKYFFTFEIVGNALQATTGHRVIPRINQSHLPRFSLTVMNFHGVARHIESDVRHVEKIISEILFNQISFITTAYNKFINVMM